MTWNTNGWIGKHCEARQACILKLDPDICCICETHLNTSYDINLTGYSIIYNNRKLSHINAKNIHGGIAFAIKNVVRKTFHVQVVSGEQDGLIILKLTHKISHKDMCVIGCYSPPENSKWNINENLIDTITIHLYSNSYDHVILTGDLNARTGLLNDHDSHIDNLTPRSNVDEIINQQGKSLIELAISTKIAIVNGRCGKSDFTCIRTNGASCVDYFLADFQTLSEIKSFSVFSIDSLGDCFPHLRDGKQISDHNPIQIELGWYCDEPYFESSTPANVQYKKTKFKWELENGDFMNNSRWHVILLQMIDRLENHVRNQKTLDDWYTLMLGNIHEEMELTIPHEIIERDVKRLYKFRKPYWDKELADEWKLVKNLKHVYNMHKTKTNHDNFVRKRNYFDKKLRQKKRMYFHKSANDLDSISKMEPKKFWNYLKSLGPKRKTGIPEFVEVNGTLSGEINVVKAKWESDFSALSVKDEEITCNYNQEFYDNILRNLEILENNFNRNVNPHLNSDVTDEEVKKSIAKLKTNKATGLDLICNEVLKAKGFKSVACKLIRFCFKHSIVPSIWCKGTISPIPKSGMKNVYNPLNYRGLMLLSCFEKLYTSVLNNRLYSYIDNNSILTDEQAGFRKGYSCLDQASILHTVINHRICNNQSTYVGFIDLKKCFDWINRKLLLYCLLCREINGRFYMAIKTLLSGTSACVKINSHTTNFFDINNGLPQGETMSPTLTCLFLHSLVDTLKSQNLGLKFVNEIVHILMYADDIALIANDPDSMQSMLCLFEKWSNNWQVNCNVAKSNVVHFRPTHVNRCNRVFQIYGQPLSYVTSYKYLGLFFDEHLNYIEGTDTLANSGHRALSMVINKVCIARDVTLNVYNTMFDSYVRPILMYFSALWGHDEYDSIENVQFRAIQYYLGLSTNAPKIAMLKLMHWIPIRYHTYVEKCRLYNRICKM